MFGLGVNRLGRLNSSIQTFTPASLFNNGEAGVWYDPSAASGSLDWRKNLHEYTESFSNNAWEKSNSFVSEDVISGPYENTLADKFVANNGASLAFVLQNGPLVRGQRYTQTIFAKAGGVSWIQIAPSSGFNNGHQNYNLATGELGTNTSGVGNVASIENIGNGWYRCSLSTAATATTTAGRFAAVWVGGDDNRVDSDGTVTPDGVKGVYIWGAQIEEASTASSYQPILSTFEIAFKTAFPSHTLYQDYQGVTPVTAVGEPVGLMLDKSEGLAQGPELVTNGTFDNNINGWVASDAGCSLSFVSNQLRITNNDSSAGGAVTSFPVVSGKIYTFRVGTSSNNVQLYLGASVNTATYFGPALSNSITWKSPVTGTVYFMVKNLSTTNGATIDIDNVSVVEVAGAHATQPTSTKRPIYARHPEGGIRNLLNYTEQFDNGYWQKLRGGLTPFESPVGDTSAFKFQQFSGETVVPVVRTFAPVIAGKVYTFSAFVKKGTRNSFSLHEQVTGNGVDSYFDILNGTVSDQGSGHIAKIQDAGNGWYRCSITYTSAFSASRTHDLRIGVTNNTAVPDDQGFTYLWGAQLEEATEASNYQKRVTDIDVTESGVGEVYYLKFDGIDDGMAITNLTSGNTPVTALFGYSATNVDVRAKFLFDIQLGRTIFAASANTAGYLGYYDGAWSEFNAEAAGIKVVTFDLVEDNAKIRIDGTQEYSDTTYDQQAIGGGIGLFSRYDRNNNFLAGNMYQTILRAAESTDEEIAKAETFVANKTGLKAQVDGIATLDLNFGANLYTAKNSNGGVI
jgi:hypothetical protein